MYPVVTRTVPRGKRGPAAGKAAAEQGSEHPERLELGSEGTEDPLPVPHLELVGEACPTFEHLSCRGVGANLWSHTELREPRAWRNFPRVTYGQTGQCW